MADDDRDLEKARAHARANQRALRRVAEAHRAEWRQALEAEKAREGIRTIRVRIAEEDSAERTIRVRISEEEAQEAVGSG